MLDSKNFALRMIDVKGRKVLTVAGTAKGGYDIDGRDAKFATFGSDPKARFDRPISLSIDEDGNTFVGDRFNHVVRMIDRKTGIITTIAGDNKRFAEERNNPRASNPPQSAQNQQHGLSYGLLFVPTDSRDLIVLGKTKH